MSYSKIILIGNLGADPESKQTRDGSTMAKLRLATKAQKKDGETSWWSVAAFRFNADFALKYLSKGDHVLVEGQVSIRKYTDKEGNPRQAVDVVADRIQSVGARQEKPAINGRSNESEEIPF